jgi:hypothetical protein
MATIELQGGLGNQLFQLAFLDYICQLNGATPSITWNDSVFKHSKLDYFNSIFKNWKSIVNNIHTDNIIHEESDNQRRWIIDKNQNTKLLGYFQNYIYILPDFVSKLNFSDDILSKYPEIEIRVFLHIRGGDYLHADHAWLHNVVTDNYYEKAITEFSENTKFLVFTNDKEYAKTKLFLQNINFTFIDENEIDSLFLMSKCAGGICANSTFSWWGAYLNPNRKLILPSKWFTDESIYTDGYFFEGCKVIDV